MRWWFRARRAHTLLAAALAVFILTVAVLQDAAVGLPSFLHGSADPVLLLLMAPVPLCATLMFSLESRLTEGESTGVRRVAVLDAGLVLSTVALAVVAASFLGLALDADAAPAAGRNVAFLAGLMLCTRAFIGPPAVMAPVAWIFAVIFLGLRGGGRAEFWTVLPASAADVHAFFAAGAALTVGTALHILRPGSPTRIRLH
ncbi:hypothetical protein AB0D24_39605 [Streptomyces javensis]|uniref:hypothetical protein n=1 Tax=Streptomyces javensis TaxID=114698 RepID=UPI0033E6EDE0